MAEPVQIRLEDRIATGGDAIGRMGDGRILFVAGALPGEEVEVVVDQARPDYARGFAIRILVPSAHRTDAPCPHHHEGCGGCPWQDVTIDAQLALKERIVLETLARVGGAAPDRVLPPARTPAVGYRTTLHVVGDTDGRPAFRRRRSHDLVAVDSCLVAHPRLAELLPDLRLDPGVALTLRTGTADGARVAVLDGPAGAGPDRVAGLPDDVAVVGPDLDAAVHETVGGRRWRVSARSFFQSGPAAATAIVDAVAAVCEGRLRPGDRLVDLYAGVGVIGGALAARTGAQLVSVESAAAAVADARANLVDLDATVVRGEVGRLGRRAIVTDRQAALVVADPARSGLGRPGVATVLALGAPTVVLVSCDPASAARDTRLLEAGGYRLASLQLVEAFPHTTHIETVCAYHNAAPPRR